MADDMTSRDMIDASAPADAAPSALPQDELESHHGCPDHGLQGRNVRPEIPVDIYELGLILQGSNLMTDRKVDVDMTLTGGRMPCGRRYGRMGQKQPPAPLSGDHGRRGAPDVRSALGSSAMSDEARLALTML